MLENLFKVSKFVNFSPWQKTNDFCSVTKKIPLHKLKKCIPQRKTTLNPLQEMHIPSELSFLSIRESAQIQNVTVLVSLATKFQWASKGNKPLRDLLPKNRTYYTYIYIFGYLITLLRSFWKFSNIFLKQFFFFLFPFTF